MSDRGTGGAVEHRSGLNQDEPLASRLAAVLPDAESLDVAVAYAKSSGVAALHALGLPARTRVAVGLGFGITDPTAVEQLENIGADVRCVDDSSELVASAFHPKLYLIAGPSRLVVLSGSANLTGAGLTTNVEQYEELRFAGASPAAELQRARFDRLWGMATPLDVLRRAGDWAAYREHARERRRLERQDRRRVLRLHADTGRLVGQLARRDTRRAPAYLGITHPDWWQQQLDQRARADIAVFWRRNTNRFQALAIGGLFFHLVNDPSGREAARSVRGFSTFHGGQAVEEPTVLWQRYGDLLGVHRIAELYSRLSVERGRAIGAIELQQLTELERAVSLEELRANGIPFARNIVSGRTLSFEELATLLELGGLGVGGSSALAADRRATYLDSV